jgi:Group II intron, maturase-specific domain
MLLVLGQDGTQVRLVQDQGPVEELAAQGDDQALADRVHPRRRVTIRRSQIAFIRGACTGRAHDGGAGGLEKAAQHARDRIREITGRERLLVPAEVIVTELNLFLRGWAGYFRYGNSARVLGQVGNYALWRLGLWLSKRGNRRHGWRWGVTLWSARTRP